MSKETRKTQLVKKNDIYTICTLLTIYILTLLIQLYSVYKIYVLVGISMPAF